jgi:hypothetical protein
MECGASSAAFTVTQPSDTLQVAERGWGIKTLSFRAKRGICCFFDFVILRRDSSRRPQIAVIPSKASRRLFFTFASCERVGLRREVLCAESLFDH